MRKADLVTRVADKTGISKTDGLATMESLFVEIKASLTDGEPVFVRGFGSFIIKERAGKIGRNIKKNLPVQIPAHVIPEFKPAKEFVLAVKTSGNNKR